MKRVVLRSLLALLVLLFVCTAVTILSLTLFRERLVSYLSLDRPVPDEFLVVEGWVDEQVLDSAVSVYESGSYSGIITTGSHIGPEYLMSTNGLLEFELGDEAVFADRGDSVRAVLMGSPVHGVYSSFAIVINGSICLEGFTTGQWKGYSVVLDSARWITEVGIYFGNDDFYGREDRNLHIRNITVGDSYFPARSEYSAWYDWKDQEKKHPEPTNFGSVAGICAHELQKRGIPDDRIVILPARENEQNRTLNSAWAVREWMKSQGFSGSNSVNVISESIHARRTYVLYRMALGDITGQIGIISVALEKERYLGFSIEPRNIVRELAGSFYYRLLFSRKRFEKRYRTGSA